MSNKEPHATESPSVSYCLLQHCVLLSCRGAEPIEVFPYVIPGSSTCNNIEDATVPKNQGETDEKEDSSQKDSALIIGLVVGGGKLGKQWSGVYWNTGLTFFHNCVALSVENRPSV